ncbi:D-alanyl-D-alanine carboxypeptidase family protein [Pseudaminobacter soli (ex Zhang et al. 2022)]|nr:D-alanyl-D-alanine carboxypeptidase family protein [Pseudaminobacter soli]
MRVALAAAAAIATLLLSVFVVNAQPFETKARQALMIDAETGTILYSKNPDDPFPPASLAKLMTMEVVFRAVKEGRLKLEQTFPVSENAWRTGGAPSGTSTMFAALKSSIQLSDLIQGVIVQAANDGCIIIAEGMAGSEEKFAELMTQRAREMGLQVSTFRNSSGLPADGQKVTARELVWLATHIWREYPDFYRIYSQPDFTWNKITQRNRNPLLKMNIGADGMGTGYTEESGYAIVASVERDGRRVFAAMSGLTSDRERAEEVRKMLDWGIDGFRKSQLFAVGETVGQAKIYGGQKALVPLAADEPVSIFMPTDSPDEVVAKIVYDGPVVAPIEQGQAIGALKVWVGKTLSQEIPLRATEAVPVGPIHWRAYDAVAELLTGWIRRARSS